MEKDSNNPTQKVERKTLYQPKSKMEVTQARKLVSEKIRSIREVGLAQRDTSGDDKGKTKAVGGLTAYILLPRK